MDTGGISDDEQGLAGLTTRQSQAAIEEAGLILFVVDAKQGPLPLDE